MALNLEQDEIREAKSDELRLLLTDLDAAFLLLQNGVTQLQTFRQEVIDNVDGIFVPEDQTLLSERLTERRDAIVAWANALPGA